MKNTQDRFLISGLSLAVLFSVGSAFAADEAARVNMNTTALIQQSNAKLQANDRKLSEIEGIIARAESARGKDKDQLSDSLSTSLSVYAKGMMDSFDTAINQAQMAAKSEGKRGTLELIEPFEALASKHEQQMNQASERGLHVWPDGRVSFLKMNNDSHWVMLDSISDFFISPAQAAIAVPVVTACKSPTNWSICTPALATAAQQALVAKSEFKTCWDAAKKPGQGIKRALCTAKLVARLA
jgi:hypothetical protein